ncbi:hypothetical protein ACP3W5_03865 [Vibrio anguillarum]|uniref:hypothetical protein n=1 Tax=Vibrio anguillarum TaxID=55601 RepID=UPI003CE9A34B
MKQEYTIKDSVLALLSPSSSSSVFVRASVGIGRIIDRLESYARHSQSSKAAW